jgi:hypothetical protein
MRKDMQRWAAAIGLFLLAFFSHTAAGQTDTEFWFVAPEVTALHGDNPVLLRFATFDAPATVTVTQPANPAFDRTKYDAIGESDRMTLRFVKPK